MKKLNKLILSTILTPIIAIPNITTLSNCNNKNNYGIKEIENVNKNVNIDNIKPSADFKTISIKQNATTNIEINFNEYIEKITKINDENNHSINYLAHQLNISKNIINNYYNKKDKNEQTNDIHSFIQNIQKEYYLTITIEFNNLKKITLKIEYKIDFELSNIIYKNCEWEYFWYLKNIPITNFNIKEL